MVTRMAMPSPKRKPRLYVVSLVVSVSRAHRPAGAPESIMLRPPKPNREAYRGAYERKIRGRASSLALPPLLRHKPALSLPLYTTRTRTLPRISSPAAPLSCCPLSLTSLAEGHS